MGHYHLYRGGLFALAVAAGLSGCGKMKDRVPEDAGHLRSTAKRLQASCASTVANQKLKGRLFDQAIPIVGIFLLAHSDRTYFWAGPLEVRMASENGPSDI